MSACNVAIKLPLYKVHLKMRLIDELYVFVGPVKDNIKDIYKKIEDKKTLTAKDKSTLKSCEHCLEIYKCTKSSKKCNIGVL